MGQRISGAGVGLAIPSYAFPTELNPANTPFDLGSAYQGLAPGQAIAVPAGSWLLNPGPYSVIQYMDPISNVWRGLSSALVKSVPVISDGFNYRVANLTGCPVSAVVTTGGSGYIQSSTTVTSSSGGSTWRAVVGGMVSLSTISNAGSGYGIPPMLFIASPPVNGVQASGYCTLQSGTVSAVTLTNVGGGYTTAPTAVIVTSPYDPNFIAGSTIVQAVVAFTLVGSGSIAAIVCTNNGASIAAAPTLTIAGAGASGAATALRMSTFASATVASAGTWTGGAYMSTVGGGAAATAQFANPAIDGTGFIPRPAQASLLGATSISSVGTIYDGGLFVSAPTVIVGAVGGALAPASTATVTATYAGAGDGVLLQPFA